MRKRIDSMVSLALLIIIYIAFISLGLPDSVLGAAWPMMNEELNVPISYAGVLSMVCSMGTIISALSFSYISRRIKTGLITAISTSLTALALFGYGLSSNFYSMIPIALVLGLGAGAIDSALNNYVALHYKAKQLSFLHACWGIGTTISPFILAYAFNKGLSWSFGYISIAIIQSSIAILLFLSIPLWKKNSHISNIDEEDEKASVGYKEALMKRGAIFALIGFLAYTALENATGLWASAYGVASGLDKASASIAAGLLFWGITIGRILTGIISDRVGDKRLIRAGILIIAIGIAMLILLPIRLLGASLFLLGIGYSPIYPAMIHQTPLLYGKKAGTTLIGLQMASSYVGSTFISPLFGTIASMTSIAIFPFYLLIFAFILLAMTELKGR